MHGFEVEVRSGNIPVDYNRTIGLRYFVHFHKLSMMQVITQAVKEGLEQHGSNLGDEALQVLQRGKPHEV
jgi:hypothetical protein